MKNKLIKHLLDFGEEIKKNGKIYDKGENYITYLWEKDEFNYFHTIHFNKSNIYILQMDYVPKSYQDGFCNVIRLEFNEEGNIYALNRDSLGIEAMENGAIRINCKDF